METIQPTMNNNNTPITNDATNIDNADIIIDENFTYDGFQVVRGEFFAHMYEPSITFNNCKVTLNTACIKKLPSVNYVQILVNPKTMKLAVRPCSEDDKDSFLWCTEKAGKRKPKQITCRLFFAKLVALMDWNPNYRYKMLGKIIKSGEEYLILFDLTATETYQRIIKEGEKPRTSRTPIFPEEWKDQFGLPVEEHKKLLQVNIFDGYTVFGLEEKKETPVQDNQLSLDTTSANESNTEHSDTGQAVSHAPSATVNTYPQNTQQNAYVQPNTTPSYQSPTDNDENTVGTGGNDYERKQQY